MRFVNNTNKFKYNPSVIKKFDVQSEEFEMYIRKLNYETKTELEKYRETREFYCKNILPMRPKLNNVQNSYLSDNIARMIFDTF